MALIGNDADTLLHGLSAFWLRFFKDIGDIQAAYEGTEVLMGQVYLNFLSDVLNTSVVEAPLFRKEYYKLITAREDQIVFEENNPTYVPPVPVEFLGSLNKDRYVLSGGTYYNSIPLLQNLLYKPTASLEENQDYDVDVKKIKFKTDPTDPSLDGYATRTVTIATGGKFYAGSVSDWAVADVKKGDVLYYSDTVDLSAPAPLTQTSPAFVAWLEYLETARKATIVHVSPTRLTVSADTPLPTFPSGATPTGFSWKILRNRGDGFYNTSLPSAVSATPPFTDGQIEYVTTLNVKEVSMWAVDAKVDDLILYKNYGSFFTNEEVSTEAYRSLIRGLMQLYMLGPAMARLESALNLTAGFPTVKEDNETLLAYDNGIVASGTNGNLLVGNVFQAESPAFDGGSVGAYVRITDADNTENFGTFNIVEYVSPTQVRLNPLVLMIPEVELHWEYTKINQQEVLTDKNVYVYPIAVPMREDLSDPASIGVLKLNAFEPLTTALRVVDYIQDPEWWHDIVIPGEIIPDKSSVWRRVNPLLYSNTVGPIGDASIGDPGYFIGADEDEHLTSVGFRHKASFILMDRFLKMHMFGVLVDPSVNLTGILTNELYKIIKEVKPVHTALYFNPVRKLVDNITAADYWEVRPVIGFVDETYVVPNETTVGGGWIIGSTWKFTGSFGGAVTVSPPAAAAPDLIPLVIGGTNPNIDPGTPGLTGTLGLIDRALYVYQHA